jgi:hypothetical protein
MPIHTMRIYMKTLIPQETERLKLQLSLILGMHYIRVYKLLILTFYNYFSAKLTLFVE